MLHVFHVDLGVLYTFEMEFAMESVQVLMSTVASVSGIPEDKQVLLISSGEALDPTERVYSYSSAGTDTNPIFLFSKSTIESSIPPSPSLNLGSETNLKEQVEKSLNLPPTYETLVSRAQLASDFDTLAAEITQSCENLVWEQKMQQNGWAAVVANLENIASEFKARANGVHQIYTEFLDAKPRYIEQLEGFKQVLPLLSRVSVLPCLLTRQQLSVGEQTSRFSLLDWISAQDTKNSLQDMAKQCEDAVEQFDESQLTEITNEVSQVLESLDNTSMKEIKGLDDRLAGLQQLLQNVQTLMQSQADMAQGFQKNQARAQNIGDPSVLPDLCTSHQKQLMLLRKNHTHLRDLRKRFAKAKDELSANLHTRLRWIMYVEKKICDCDSTVIMYHENIRRIKRRLEIIEQVNEAPRLYILAVSEVVRRRTFSSQFQKWASKLSNISVQARAEEIARREDFELHFGHHFLQNLFGGLEDRPPRFLDKPPKGFDELLPIITERDLQELQEQIPELSTYLDFSPINISMKDETGKVSGLQSEEHKNLEAIFQFQPMFVGSKTIESMTYKKASHVVTEMSASEDKGTQMSIDASTQVEWAVEEDECSPSKMEPELEMSSTQNLAGKEEITELSSKAATQQTVRTADVSSTHERKKSSSESASEESDLVFRSAHDDYVTVFEADLEGDPQELDVPLVSQPVGECQEQCVALLNEASQTTTLTSSGTQSSDQSTQTEHSFDENWPVQESGIQGVLSQTVLDLEQQASDRTRQTSLDDMVERLSQLEARLSSTQEVLERTSAEKQQLQEANSNVREFWCREMQEIRNFLSKEKQLISEWDLQIKEDILEGISKVRQIQEKDHNYIAQNIAQRTKEEFEKKTTQLSLEFEKERNVFLEDKVKLECEKIEILKQLEQLRIDKETSEIQHQEESHKLASLLGEYKAKLDEQQGTAQKLQENKSRSDEDQQIRFNAIIMKLKREKEQAVSQAQEKLNELKSLLEQQEEGMRLLVMEKENIEQARKREHDEFYQREENLLTDLQSKEAKIKEAETVMKTKEAEFQEQLEQEKISALMLLQVEQQMWEANRKVQATDTARETKCSTDTVQEEDHQQKIRALEEENQKLRERLSEGIGTDEGSQLVKFRQVLDIKDQEILSLQQQLSQMQKMTGTASAAAGASKSEKISLRDFQVGDLILLLFEERYENYLVLSTGQTLFFLHPDSMAGLDLATSGPKRRPWMLAQMTDKEYCQAKKPHNRFHVPVGTKFYRIQAKSWKW